MSKTMFGNINNLVLSNGTAVVQENSTPIIRNIDNITSDFGDFNHSFVQEGYQFLMEYNAEYYGALKKFYSDVALSEGSEYIIHESFGGIWSTIKKLIRKFIDFIKRCFLKLSEKLHSLFKAEKYIKKHKDLIYKFDTEDEFQVKGYTYTFENEVPFTEGIPGQEINNNGLKSYMSGSTGLYDMDKFKDDDYGANGAFKDYIEGDSKDGSPTAKFKTLPTDDNNKTFIALCKKYHEDIINTRDKYFSVIRAAVIGKKNTEISESEFAEELRLVFRDDEKEPSTIDVDAQYIQQCYMRFENYSTALKEAEKARTRLEREYNNLEKWVDGVSKSTDKSTVENSNNSDMVTSIVTPVKALANASPTSDLSKITQFGTVMKDISANIHKLSTIHSQAYTAKIEAIKEEFAQNKSILYKAIAKVLKNKKGDKK